VWPSIAAAFRTSMGRSDEALVCCVLGVQEFMGRKLLAMNVMWKYREQVCARMGKGGLDPLTICS